MSDPRAELARQQALLLAALHGEAEAPAGFDRERLALAGSGLRRKRARAAARAWPALHQALGSEFFTLFAKHVSALPLARRGAPLLDGLRLVRAIGAPSSVVERQLLEVQLRFVERRTGLEPRRGPTVVVGRVGSRLVLAVRWGRHTRAINVPVWRRGATAQRVAGSGC